MNPATINSLLYRTLKKGVEYENLMPLSTCDSNLLATGDTKKAIDNMVFWSKEYQSHTEKLTSKIFKNYTLSVLCKEIHSFLYHHFQYKIDGYHQQLRSPGCAWATREEGIDCKSYSIIASTILLNRGISHYFRRVAQNEGEGYSHVYVVVPKNQKSKQLKDGYYTIDGTLETTKEVVFYKKDDVFVSTEAAIGLGSSIVKTINNSASKVISVVTDLLIKGFLNEVLGCDDADYEAPIVKLRLTRDLLTPLNKRLKNLAYAISINNEARIEHIFNSIFKEIDLGVAHLRNETAYSQRDTCIAKTLATALVYVEKVKESIDIFYNNFKKNYTNFEIEQYYTKANVGDRLLYFVVENASNPIIAEHRFIKIKKKSDGYGVVPYFGFQENHLTWLHKNCSHLKITYKDGREKAYKKEILPLIEKTIALRKKYRIGGEMLYYYEQPIQLDMTDLWLKYDDKYKEFRKQKALKNYNDNEKELTAHLERFNQEVVENQNAQKRKKDKIQLGVGISVVALLFAINID